MNHISESVPPAWRKLTWGSLSVAPLLAVAYYTGTAESHRWLWSEQGPLELSHVLIPSAAMVLGIATLGGRKRIASIRTAGLGWLAAAICGLALLCGVIAGEEASWGQHLWGWSTPEAWSELNDQQETNLHNIGTWADQKPRAVVELGITVFGILWPLWSRFTSVFVPSAWRLILPSAVVLPVALFAEAVRLLESVPGWLGRPCWAAFPRPSELQEFYFYTFFALCMLCWRHRLLAGFAQSEEQQSAAVRLRNDAPFRERAA